MRTKVFVISLTGLLVFACAPIMVATAASVAPEVQTPEEVLRQQQGTYAGWRCWHWANKCARCPEGYSLEGGPEDNSVRCEGMGVLPEWATRDEIPTQKPGEDGWYCGKMNKCARCPEGYYLTEEGRGFSVRCEKSGTTPDKRSRIVTVSGEVMIQRPGEGSFLATEGTYIAPGDIVTTGADSILRIALEFRDPDFPSSVTPEYVTIGADSEVHIEELEYYSTEKQEERGVIDLIKGVIRSFSRSWRARSIFSVKAGTTLCGRRGSDVLVCHDPGSKKVSAYVLEGHMDVSSTETGEIRSLTENQKLVVENGIFGSIQSLSENERDILVVGKKVTCDFGTTVAMLPDVVGLTASDAKEKLTAAGFVMKPLPGIAAPSEDEVGKVQSQAPKPGKRMEGGAQVSITVYGPYVAKPTRQEFKTIVIPDVKGLTANQARQRILDAGLEPAFRPGMAASTSSQGGVVERMHPEPGTVMGPGDHVEIYVYGPHVATTSPPKEGQGVTQSKEQAIEDLIVGTEWQQGRWVYTSLETFEGELRYFPGSMKFVKDGNTIIGVITEAQGSSESDLQVGHKYYELIRKVDPVTFLARRYSVSPRRETEIVYLSFPQEREYFISSQRREEYSKDLEVSGLLHVPSRHVGEGGWDINKYVYKPDQYTGHYRISEWKRKGTFTGNTKNDSTGRPDTARCEWEKNPGGLLGQGQWDGTSWVCVCGTEVADESRCEGLPKK